MKIPKYKKIKEGESIRSYKFIKKCNDNLYLYEEVNHKWKRCFDKWELGGISEMVKPPKRYVNPERAKL